MKINVFVNEDMYQVDVSDDMLVEAEEIFAKMDEDMDKGWQMSREWVDDLDKQHRCKIAADRLLTAIENDNEPTMKLMAGYIMTRMPGIESIYIATDGDMNQTQLVMSS